MLEPKDRQTLLQLLRPPLGCRFDCAIGTTFSLDLMALLTAPLAMAMFDWQDAEGELAGDPSLSGLNPLELLESLRRCADRVHIFCQAGQICVPPAHQRLLTYLEQSVVQVLAPAARQKRRGVFHPKVWVLRYLDGSQTPRYRLLCLTRNLTFDRSWDAVAAFDGIVKDRERGLSVNRPLVQFLEALPGMRIRCHFHNTRNTGLANAYAAVEAGAVSLDASAGGIGGCPFAPAATGNIPTEDLVYMLHRSGISTGVDLDKLLDTSRWLQETLGRPVPGMLLKAGGFPRPAQQAA